MTRKEIEEMCRKEMQQEMQDKEALWQRIEAQLPPKTPAAEVPAASPISMNGLRRVLTLAACFMLVVAGVTVYTKLSPLKEANNTVQSDDSTNPTSEQKHEQEDERTEEAEEPSEPEQTTELLRYEELAFSADSHEPVVLDASRLGTQGSYFAENDVLERTDCFVEVRVLVGSQNPDDGCMNYTMEVQEIYGEDNFRSDTLVITTESAYLLEIGHQYLLPVQQAENGMWQLSYACAPQLELTEDGGIVYHSGWHSLRQAAEQPLQYEKVHADDYFYDRMYLGNAEEVFTVVKGWAKEGFA